VDEAQEHGDGRRLAGPIRAEEAEDLPARDFHGEAFHRGRPAEAFGQIPGPDYGSFRHAVSREISMVDDPGGL
jgi:hypothetical protein